MVGSRIVDMPFVCMSSIMSRMPLAPKDARARLAPLVAHVAREWRRAVDGRLQPFGLTEATWLPLLRIARSETPMRQNELAASLSLDCSSVVRLIDALENSGFIERCEDPRRSPRKEPCPNVRVDAGLSIRSSLYPSDIRDARVSARSSDDDLGRTLRLLETVRDRLLSLPDGPTATAERKRATVGQ